MFIPSLGRTITDETQYIGYDCPTKDENNAITLWSRRVLPGVDNEGNTVLKHFGNLMSQSVIIVTM